MFEPISGAPTDDDIECIHCSVVNLLQGFRYRGTKDSLFGLVDNNASYHRHYGHSFNRLQDADATNYNESIPLDVSAGG